MSVLDASAVIELLLGTPLGRIVAEQVSDPTTALHAPHLLDATQRPGDWLRQHPGLRLLPCVQNERLLVIPGPLLATTSPHLVRAAVHVQNALRSWGRP